LLNCPNCGAPIFGWKCEYCGTVFDNEPHIYQDLSNNAMSIRDQLNATQTQMYCNLQTQWLLNSLQTNVSQIGGLNDLVQLRFPFWA